MIKHLKSIFSSWNIMFMLGSIVASILILNVYNRIVTGFTVPVWIAMMTFVASIVGGIFIAGWLFKLRRRNMHKLELLFTILIIAAVMLLMLQYAPQWLYGAKTFIEPSRQALVDLSRGISP